MTLLLVAKLVRWKALAEGLMPIAEGVATRNGAVTEREALRCSP